MKLSDTGKFPIFEIHHNNIKMIINILCFTDEKTNFILDSDPTNVKTYVSMKIAIILPIIMMIYINKLIINNICSILS